MLSAILVYLTSIRPVLIGILVYLASNNSHIYPFQISVHVVHVLKQRYSQVFVSLHGDGASLERTIGVGFCAAFLADHDDRSLSIKTWSFGVFRHLKIRGDTY